MLINGPDEYSQPRTLQLLPMPLKSYGTNLYDEPIFRIVFSESRTYMVGAVHVDHAGAPANDRELAAAGGRDNVVRRESGYRHYPLYPGAKCWILEQWKSPFGFTGMTAAAYHEQYFDPASNTLTLGPYPDRGEYVECFRFPSTEAPPASAVARVINAIKAGWNYSFAEHKQAIESQQEQKKKNYGRRVEDVFLDSQQAFKNRPSNIRPGKRTKDKIPLRYTAEQVGLRRRGPFTAGQRLRTTP